MSLLDIVFTGTMVPRVSFAKAFGHAGFPRRAGAHSNTNSLYMLPLETRGIPTVSILTVMLRLAPL